MYKSENQIYKLTEEDEKMLSEHMKFYEDFNKYGFFILDNCFGNDIIEDYELTIYSSLYKILEILDTLEVMTENSLINSGYIIVRSLLEEAVQLAYMINDTSLVEKRAIILQMLDIKRTSQDESLFYSEMKKKSCYKNFVCEIEGKEYNNWYSFCEGKKTLLKDLFTVVGWQNLYTELYQPLCKEAHVITHMESNIVPSSDGKFSFKPFRNFENHNSLMKCIQMTIIPLYSAFFDRYDSLTELKDEWDEYSKKTYEYIERAKIIVELFGNMGKHFY